uniref:Small ribosomal subunit protein mS31 n=1 Tax=Geotrypetes seraphini TaxID=260995 RepID=A0A6P8RLP3_GEOSA|nr:28S ribosomal protein S31, mitochondrial isoform X3 [Geotrypetes seraphini]
MYGWILLGTRTRPVPAVLQIRFPVPGIEEPVGGCRRSAVKGQKWFNTSKYVCVCEKKDEPSSLSSARMAEKEEKVDQATPEKAKANLLNLISAMKVEISSKKRFQALKMKEHAKKMENIESTSSMFQKATEDNERKSDTQLSPELVAAASAVATSLPFNKTQIESELLRQLRSHEEEAAQRRSGSHNIRRGLFTKKRLNIFPGSYSDAIKTPEADSSPTLWDLELAKQIAAAGHQPPRNGFQEMIQWTKEGKLWEFPINNEAGIKRLKNTGIDHVADITTVMSKVSAYAVSARRMLWIRQWTEDSDFKATVLRRNRMLNFMSMSSLINTWKTFQNKDQFIISWNW